MSEYGRIIQSWQPFYSTIAGAAATLIGLLFVSLTFNRDRLDGDALSVARRTFVNLVDVLLIALMFLVPHNRVASLALALFVYGLARTVTHLRELLKSSRGQTGARLRNARLPLLASTGLIVIAVVLLEVGPQMMFLPVFIILFLIASAAGNAWDLLLKE